MPLFWIFWALAWGICLFGTVQALRKTSRKPSRESLSSFSEGITCLKPLKGIDPGLEVNLESFFLQDDPRFELIFSAADEEDPALAVVRTLMRRYPKVPARIIQGETSQGENPKVANLIPAYARAQHDWILISDSNVRVSPDYFRNLRLEFGSDVGLLTAVVAGKNARGVGGMLEETFLNTFYFRGMFLAEAFGHPCVVGKCMLFRKSELDRVGGISNFRRYLAEDFMAGIAMGKLGKRVAYARTPVPQHIGHADFRKFWSRHLRWGRLRKAHAPIPFFLEPFLSSIGSGWIGMLAWRGLSSPIFFLGLHLAAWFSLDALLAIRASERGERKRLLWLPFAWLARESIHPALWVAILLGSDVEWRGKRLRIKHGGLLAGSW